MKINLINNKISKNKLIMTALEFNYLLLIFLVPIWFAYLFPIFNMFELSKLIVFQFLVWSFFILTLIRLIHKNNWFYFFSKNNKNLKNFFSLFWPAILLIVGLFISLLFSLDPIQSFIGSYDRWQGVYSYFLYFLFAVLLFVNLVITKKEGGKDVYNKKIKDILVATSFSAFVVSIYGILQIMNIDFIVWPEQPFITGRTISTLGQPNFLASFLLLTIPISAYLAYLYSNIFYRSFFVLTTVLQIITMFFTSSRGGLLSLLFVLFLFVLYLFFSSNLKKKHKVIVIASFLLFSIFSLGAVEFFVPGRISGSFDLKRGSLAARVNFFQSAADSILDKPLFGYGLENGKQIFIKYYETDWGIYADVGANTDRAHNIILDIMLSAGFFGLIIFSLWYYSFFKLAVQETRFGNKKYLSLAIALAAAGYLTSLFFSFPIVAGQIYFWMLFAILASLSFNLGDKRDVSKSTFAKFIILILIISSFIPLVFAYRSLLADYYQNKMHKAVNNREFIRAAILKKQIFELNPNEIQKEKASYFLGTNLSNYCNYSSWRDLSEEKIIKKNLAYTLDELNDDKYENLFLKAKIYSCLGENNKADEYFGKVSAITPRWPLNYLEWGRHYARLGDAKTAEKYYSFADYSLPDLSSELINNEHKRAVNNYKYLMYNSLANLYSEKGDHSRARLFYELAYKSRPSNFSLFKKIANTYYLQGDIENAIKYIKRGAQKNADDYNWWLALSALYYEDNNQEEAVENLNKAIDLAPQSRKQELEEIMNNYKS